jgi:hypothetical protein
LGEVKIGRRMALPMPAYFGRFALKKINKPAAASRYSCDVHKRYEIGLIIRHSNPLNTLHLRSLLYSANARFGSRAGLVCLVEEGSIRIPKLPLPECDREKPGTAAFDPVQTIRK